MNTQAEYEAYQRRVAEFISRENLSFISTGTNNGEDGDVDPWFSWHACDCCQSPLGGNREYLWAWSGDTRVEFEICEDCVYYIEYGRLDDMTMERIAKSRNLGASATPAHQATRKRVIVA